MPTRKRTENRYDFRRESDGSWTVFDIFTGHAAVTPGGQMCDGLDMETADDLVDLLNGLDIKRRGS